ncbi:hypothetical protein ACF3NA_04130 [Alkanindiges sp. WGS2144]|uniref:hypothetical protein n=1 Tax=Alkanindiges sp. WGS2144 TaxID=3366808 RepID=UPI003750AD57
MRFLIVTVWLVLPLLVACSREPSEKELQQAYQHSLDQANQLGEKIGGKNMQIGLKEFKKLSCQKATEQKQYHCHIQVNLELPIIGSSTQQGEISVAQQDGQWIVVQQ